MEALWLNTSARGTYTDRGHSMPANMDMRMRDVGVAGTVGCSLQIDEERTRCQQR